MKTSQAEEEGTVPRCTKDFSRNHSVIPNSSGLAHLYGLPKAHKKQLAMRLILSATGTYHWKLAKWLDEKLKPLSVNDHTTVIEIFLLADDVHEMEVNVHDILMSYDVPASAFHRCGKKSNFIVLSPSFGL